ncbi:MAG: hypothetical protein JXL84_25495 [Deltaproteobacteria bacterium]|nr:hypothetical protein [Deltaproteobacteria bacterium]
MPWECALPMKRLGYRLILVCGAAISMSLVFVSALSVWVGLTHLHREGFWVPILAGAFAAGLGIYLFWRLARHVHDRMNRTDSINL